MKTFKNWCASVLEEVATQPAKTLSGDVDTIISSLDTLVRELTEELASPEFNELNEAEDEISTVWQWMWWMPKARKAQQKVNKIKLNVTDLESAAADAPNAEQRANLNAKAKQVSDQSIELQKMVSDKFSSKGKLVQKAVQNEKIKGQIAAITRASGMEDDPNKKSDYKEKLAELQTKYKEDQAAIAELEPSEEDKDKEKEKKEKEKLAADKRQKELDDAAKGKKTPEEIEAEKNKGKTPEEIEAEKNKGKTPEEIEAEKNKGKTPEEIEAEKNKGKDDNTEKIATKTTEIEQLKASLAAENAKETKDDTKISDIEGKIQTAQQELNDLKAPPPPPPVNASLVIRANAAGLNELATEISSKFSWQVSRGTVLHQKYEEIIKKAEYSNKLNESRYQNLSISQKFSRLL